uniref:tetrahydrofolate synthase n=1 Tax=Strigomonas galati TaxID=1003336 RepID=T1YUT2_9TRYP|nr:tetrahydrofolate synthase [Strigomonas galati]
MASTLHKGITAESYPGQEHQEGPASRLGGTYEVKRGTAAGGEEERETPRQESRSFADVQRVVVEMTSGRPNRCPDNIPITIRLIDRLGLKPVLGRVRFVHIAGTKGKGTTAAYTAALLQAYGFKVGLFTSPHLVDIRERILVDNGFLSPDTFARYFFEFKKKMDALEFSNSQLDRDVASRANFFRFFFLLSLYIFEQESVEVAVMEVGIGGRIDATNTVPSEVSIITSLGYDHMDLLGNSLAEIAGEKAGILKQGVPCFAAPQADHPETRAVLEEVAKAQETPLIFLDKDVLPIHQWPALAIGGAHAVEDSKLAVMAARRIAGIPPIAPLDEVERHVLQSLTFAGRSQVVPVDGGRDMTLYLDGAHTPESLRRATEWFLEASAGEGKGPDAPPRRVLVLYTSRDPKLVLKAFMPYISHFCKVVIAQVQNPKQQVAGVGHHGAAPGVTADEEDDESRRSKQEVVAVTTLWRDMYREVTALPCGKPFLYLEDMLDLIVPAASDNENAALPAQVFVCGSFYLVGDVLKLVSQYEHGLRRDK